MKKNRKTDQKTTDQKKTKSVKLEKSRNSLYSILECGVCVDTVVEPYTLGKCGHTFCWDCISNWDKEKSHADGISCPQCRIKSYLPGHYIGNNMLKQILDEIVDDEYTNRINIYFQEKSFKQTLRQYHVSSHFINLCQNINEILDEKGWMTYETAANIAGPNHEVSLKYILATHYWDIIVFIGEMIVLSAKTVIGNFICEHPNLSSIENTYLIYHFIDPDIVNDNIPPSPNSVSKLYDMIYMYPNKKRPELMEYLNRLNLDRTFESEDDSYEYPDSILDE